MYGRDPALRVHLPAWCRRNGPRVEWPDPPDPDGPVAVVVRGDREDARWYAAERTGSADPAGVVDKPPQSWGLAARGALVDLLAFLERHAPDPVTRRAAWLAMQDERRHVLFGVAHPEQQAAVDPGLRGRLRTAIECRHDAPADTAGLNENVFDALVVLAAGQWTPEAISAGYTRVQELQRAMDRGRRRRLLRLGFPPDEAAELSALHTRNSM